MSETLRDNHGEIIWRIGQLFDAQILGNSAPATFEIVLVERDRSPIGKRNVCVRLYGGEFTFKGERFWIQEDKQRPRFYLSEELVCGCLRKQYGSTQPVESKPIPQRETVKKTGARHKAVAEVVKDDRQEGLFK